MFAWFTLFKLIGCHKCFLFTLLTMFLFFCQVSEPLSTLLVGFLQFVCCLGVRGIKSYFSFLYVIYFQMILLSYVLYGVSFLSLNELLTGRQTTFHSTMLPLFLYTQRKDILSGLISPNKEDDSCHTVQ